MGGYLYFKLFIFFMWDVTKLDCYWLSLDLIDDFKDVVKKIMVVKDFRLARQIESSVESIGANMSEGSHKRTSVDYCKFLNYATGSCGEVENWARVCFRKGYVDVEKRDNLIKKVVGVRKMIYGVIKRVKIQDRK